MKDTVDVCEAGGTRKGCGVNAAAAAEEEEEEAGCLTGWAIPENRRSSTSTTGDRQRFPCLTGPLYSIPGVDAGVVAVLFGALA